MRGRNDVQNETRLAWIEKNIELKEKYARKTAVIANRGKTVTSRWNVAISIGNAAVTR